MLGHDITIVLSIYYKNHKSFVSSHLHTTPTIISDHHQFVH